MKKKITFYANNPHEEQIFMPIAQVAKKKNFKINFSKNLKKKSDIGFYCFSGDLPINANTSIIFLGGMDQGRVVWPNVWKESPWNKFDIGFLPGREWSNRWLESSWFYKSRTKHGVFESGWPKADIIKNKKLYEEKNKKIKKKYSIPNKRRNILYAPSFECNNKQIDVANSAKKLNYNLIVKHWIKEKKGFEDLRDRVKFANNETKKLLKKKAIIIDPKESFINILPSADILITDESSVAYEALLLNIPTLSVSDWKMQRHKLSLSRFVKPSKVCFVTNKSNLTKKIKKIIENKVIFQKKIRNKKTKHFSNLGFSATIVVDILIQFLENKELSLSKYYLNPKHNISMVKLYYLNFSNFFHKVLNRVKKLIIN